MFGLLTFIGSGVLAYALSPSPVPAVAPLVIAVTCALGTGLGFGIYVLPAEYQGLPTTLTAVSGHDISRGTLLAGLTLGIPLTLLLTILSGIGSPVRVVELILVGVLGCLLCVCAITTSMALGMQFAYSTFVVVPSLPLASLPWMYGQQGNEPFRYAGQAIGVLVLVALPAFASYVGEIRRPVATELGVTPATIHIGAFVSSILLAAVLSVIAYRRAVRRFDAYQLP